ncbi:rod shape-determining protein MreD [Nocardiopsis algeriensis]|uniref:rod shape-determining protein MreD n=1 Tax=Nocardiopsis algeriensis TaxID=1478215 RepID=UPI003B43A9B4
MRTAVTLVLLAVAVLLQAAVVNRLPLDWGPGPDLVLAAVVAVALTAGPAAAAGCGFAAGLALDALPPAAHELGRGALVLCLAAYLLSLFKRNTGAFAGESASSLPTVVGAVTATAFGVGLGHAILGLAVGDPRIGLVSAVLNTCVGTLLTALVSPLVTLPLLRVRTAFTDEEFATVQGPTSPEGW